MPIVLLLILALLTASPASAASCDNVIDASDPGRIAEVARGFGSADIGTDDMGDPKINGRMHGVKYTIYFYGCENGKQCTTIQIRAGFKVKKKQTVSRMNQWNTSKRFGKALIDKDGDPLIEMNVNLAGGVCPENLGETLDWWSTALREFLKHIEFND